MDEANRGRGTVAKTGASSAIVTLWEPGAYEVAAVGAQTGAVLSARFRCLYVRREIGRAHV